MKTLIIVRHAKSSWDFPNLSDQERPLIEKGIKRTRKIIKKFLEYKLKVDLILTSHAVRAHETARLFAEALKYPDEKIQIHPKIYVSDAESLHTVLFDVPQNVNTLMIFGHNPTLTTFANYFLFDKIDWLPTSGMVCITFETTNWESIYTAKRKVKFVILPKK